MPNVFYASVATYLTDIYIYFLSKCLIETDRRLMASNEEARENEEEEEDCWQFNTLLGRDLSLISDRTT